MTESDGYIYVIHCSGSTYYKIGITRGCVDCRMRQLQTGSPHKLTLVMLFWVLEPEEEERRIHQLCAPHLVNGEWYNLNPQAFAEVIYAINPMMVGYEPIPQ